jgi:predicted component of type VI protein secretion system
VTQIVLEWQASNGKRLQKVNSMQTVTIGRHPGCDIVLGDPHVSRRHASINFSDDSFHLQNHSQTNPIIFNDRWSLSRDLRADLKPGDTFTVGRVRIKVTLPIHGSNGHGPNGASHELQCPSCGRPMEDKRATCPLCRTSIAQIETVLMSQDSW